MYGACLPRFRHSDFEEVAHHGGISPAWPFSYDDIEPFYAKAEELFEVHGALGEDRPSPSTPRRTLIHCSATNRSSNGSPYGSVSRACTRFTCPMACTCRQWSNGAPIPLLMDLPPHRQQERR
jgi:choline dehydrogenase-like flavoprotein